jgi:hypothetical protein
LQKALYNHHRGHARAISGARPREVPKRTPKTTSALECSAQAHRNHTWEHVEVINRHETLHSLHQHHAKYGGVRYGSGVRLGSRRNISTSVLACACSRCVLLKWPGFQYWGSKRKTPKYECHRGGPMFPGGKSSGQGSGKSDFPEADFRSVQPGTND